MVFLNLHSMKKTFRPWCWKRLRLGNRAVSQKSLEYWDFCEGRTEDRARVYAHPIVEQRGVNLPKVHAVQNVSRGVKIGQARIGAVEVSTNLTPNKKLRFCGAMVSSSVSVFFDSSSEL